MRPSILAALLFPFAVHAQSGLPPTDPNVELIKRVQERLHAHGYDVGRVDGVLDQRTQGAVAQFQLSRALPAGGTIDRDTLKELGVDMAEIVVEQPSSVGGTAETAETPEKR